MPLKRTVSSIEAIASSIQFARSVSAPSISPTPSVPEDEQSSRKTRPTPSQPRGALEERLLHLTRSFSDNVLLAKSPASANAHSLMTGDAIGDKVVSYLQHLFRHVMARHCQLVSRPIPHVESMDSSAIGVYCVETNTCLAAVVFTSHGLTRRTEEFFDLLQRLRVYSDIHFPFGILTNGLQFQLYWLPDEICCTSLSEAIVGMPDGDDDDDEEDDEEDATAIEGDSLSPDTSNRIRKSIKSIDGDEDSPGTSRSTSIEVAPSTPQLLDSDANVIARKSEHQRALCSSMLSVIVHARSLSSLLCASLSLAFASNINASNAGEVLDVSYLDGPLESNDIIAQLREQCFHNMQSHESEHLLLAICPSSSGSSSSSSRSQRPLHRTEEAFWITVPRNSLMLSLQPPSSSRSLKKYPIYLLRDLHGGADGRVWLACSAKSGRLVVIKFLSRKTMRDKHGRLETPYQAARRECSYWKEVGFSAWTLTLLGHQCVVMPYGLSLQLVHERRLLNVNRETENQPVDLNNNGTCLCEENSAAKQTVVSLTTHGAFIEEPKLIFKFSSDKFRGSVDPSSFTICGFKVLYMAEFQSQCISLVPSEVLQESIALFSQRKLVHDDIEWRHVALFPQFKKRSLSSSFSNWWKSFQRPTHLSAVSENEVDLSTSPTLGTSPNTTSFSPDLSNTTKSKGKARLVRAAASFLDLTRVHRVDSAEEARYLMLQRVAGKLAHQFTQ